MMTERYVVRAFVEVLGQMQQQIKTTYTQEAEAVAYARGLLDAMLKWVDEGKCEINVTREANDGCGYTTWATGERA